MEQILVSAIITTCKREPSIVHRAIMSVINQTYEKVELIVVDDSPADYDARENVKNMIEDVQLNSGKRIVYIQHDICKGACAARNTGLESSKGSIVGFLDDDDEWLPTKIETMLTGFSKPEIALVYCNHLDYNVKTGTINRIKHASHMGRAYDALILGNFIGSTSFPLIKKKALISIGGFDLKMQSSQDYDVWLRLANIYEINYVDDYLVKYYVHEGEQISKNALKRINGLERIIEKNKAYIDRNSLAFWQNHMKIIKYYVRNGEKRKAIKIWTSCVGHCPFKISGNIKYFLYIVFKSKSL